MDSEDLKPLERVVVLVDDLDRSLPDTVVKTLEAIKLFLSVKKMAFVIAADEENVANAIGRRLRRLGSPSPHGSTWRRSCRCRCASRR